MVDDAVERRLRTTILRLLSEREAGKTICPSEVARAVAGDDRRDWELLMEPTRSVAQRLVVEGKIVVTQRGTLVDGATAKGPIRLRLR